MEELHAKIDKLVLRDATRNRRLDNLEKRVEELAQSVQLMVELQHYQAQALVSIQREISSVHEDVQQVRRVSYDDEDEFIESSSYNKSLGSVENEEDVIDVEKERKERLRLERELAEREARAAAREAERQRDMEKKRKEEKEERERERLREIEREKERKRLEEERKRKEELRKKREAEKRAKTLEIMGSLFDDNKGNTKETNLFGGSAGGEFSRKKGTGLFDDDDDDGGVGVEALLKKAKNESPQKIKKEEKTKQQDISSSTKKSLFGDDSDDEAVEPTSIFD